MKRPPVRDKSFSDTMKKALVRCLLTFALAAAQPGGLYAPWALAAVAVDRERSRGLWTLIGTCVGALVWFDFQAGLRLAASALLIYCTNVAFCDTKLYGRQWFAPTLSAGALLLVQSVYLLGRNAEQWALAALSGAVAAAAAYAMDETRDDRRLWLLAVMAAAVATLSGVPSVDFSPGGLLAAWLTLLCACAASPANAFTLGAGLGVCAGMTSAFSALLWAAVYACGALAVALLQKRHRLWQALAFCLCALIVPLALDADRPWTVLYAAAAGSTAYVLLPGKWLPERDASASDRTGHAAVPTMAVQAVQEQAAAYQTLYNTMFRSRSAEKGENPSVIFDRAAGQVCRGCTLVQRCWQTEYTDTYNAFNDACGIMLKRGRALAEDFPLFFTSRCLRFSALLSAVNSELYAFRLRQQYRIRLENARTLAEAQYEYLGETLGGVSDMLPQQETPLLRCRVGTLLRPKEGETVCGDQTAVFTAGSTLYMLLSDGMGSGAAAHAESAMTVRLLRQFLKAGILPVPALKTINTALTLRCQEGGGFTTIDLLALDRHSGAATLYKYGAAASYVKKNGAVLRLDGGSLPAGLQDTHRPPETTGFRLESGHVLVMVSDGVTGEDDGWLRELLAEWAGSDTQELAQLLLAESRRHGGLRDDCAVLALRVEKSVKNGAGQV